MEYEIAKQLKDAGFPQIPHNRDCLAAKRHGINEVQVACLCLPYLPTLEELIEAFGEKFGRLDHVIVEGVEAWVAYSSRIENEINVPAYIFQQGSTPVEAVAPLWLELNKKNYMTPDPIKAKKVKAKIQELCPDVMIPEVCDFPSTGGHHVKKLTLAVVLRAIGKSTYRYRFQVSSVGDFECNKLPSGIVWNLEHDNYDAQSQETQLFIGNLLGI